MVSFAPIGFSEEGENNKEGGSINEIILRQIRKIGDICSKELTGGYWQKRPIKVGDGIVFSEEYHEDLREAYCNSIIFTVDLSYPNSDNKFKEFIKKFDGYEEEVDIKKKVNICRQIFKELNIMFTRYDFFEGGTSADE